MTVYTRGRGEGDIALNNFTIFHFAGPVSHSTLTGKTAVTRNAARAMRVLSMVDGQINNISTFL
jgi:hypothetical protein